MDNTFKQISPCPGVTPLAIFVLELGKAIQDHRPKKPFGKVTDPAPGDPDELPVTTLIKRTAGSRKLFTFQNGSPDPIEIRAYSVVAYLQTMTDSHPNIRLVSELVGQEDCGHALEARLAIYRLCKNGALSLRDSTEKKWNCYVSLSPAGVALMGLRRKEFPILFTSRMITATDSLPIDPLAKIPSPIELADKVNQTVFGMPETVASLSTHIVMHMRRARLIREGKDFSGLGNTCICLIGESGCGKTFAIHELGKASGLPFGSNASPDFSITGFVGLNADDALRPVLSAAGNNPALARFSICHMDEWDKLRSPMDSSGSMHVSTTGVVHSFLRLIEGADVICNAKRSSAWNEQTISMSTVGTCFAFSGVFKGLREEMKIKDKGRIGFVTDGGKEGKMLQDAMTCWGMPREWVNRLSVIQFIPPPTLGLLMRVAAAENGVIAAYNRLLEEDGKSFSLTEAAVRELAAHALESKGYARAVKMGIAKCCELVMGGSQKGRTEYSLTEIRKVVENIEGGI